MSSALGTRYLQMHVASLRSNYITRGFYTPCLFGTFQTMTKKEFEKLVVEGYERLPEWVRLKIKNVALLIEDEPSPEVREREGLRQDETLLGYYQGIPLSARGEQYGVGITMPDTITIYQKPILEMVDDECGPDATMATFEDRVRDVVAETVWHEFAHHFGMDEEEVREREEKRDVEIDY